MIRPPMEAPSSLEDKLGAGPLDRAGFFMFENKNFWSGKGEPKCI